MAETTVILANLPHEGLPARLADSGVAVVLAPELNDLPDDHPAAQSLRRLAGPLIVVAELYPRAAYWRLHALGVAGRRADRPGATPGRDVHCLDATGLSEADLARRILALAAPQAPAGAAPVRDLSAPCRPRWYPVIDYDRCVHCMQCVEFCLFGVYEVAGDDRAVVAQPDRCKPGCPACSRVCPQTAVIFPHFHARGPIAGADEGRPERFQGDAARHASRQDVQIYQQRHGLGQPSVQLGVPTPRPAVAPEGQKLDRVIEELESFDA